MTIAIYGSRRQQGGTDSIVRFLDMLASRGDDVVMHHKLYASLWQTVPGALAKVHRCTLEHVDKADLVVSIGGDGTFLRAALWIGELDVPVVGFNSGHLGYLTALPIDELPNLLGYLADDLFVAERRSLLEIVSPQLPASIGNYALNEVAIAKEESASMVTASVSLDGGPLADYRADGLIVCTSTGSTAYNLSVGGPIVQPTAGVYVIAPVAAHSLTMRPMVIGPQFDMSIVPSGRSSHVRLAVDGRSVLIDMGTEIYLRPAARTITILQLRQHTFSQILRQKLHWGENLWR